MEWYKGNGSIRPVSSNKQLVKSKHIYFVSISGNTILQISRLQKLQKDLTAITAQSKSKLARGI